ncbi:MAG TPA: fumarate reductase/succinate dehydrogenase flavoprotein subunit, partial [Polyangiaceae bacterium]|nr:fumarate reductase/succinate dehydrogenase flavoprotein subunit [Polyangiaceae bacterium]
GTGLAGAGAAAALGELGYAVKAFCFHDSPRRAHSVAAQGGVNAAKNYQNDGDNVYRMFLDTMRGGDFRSREANVYRMAELSVDLIDTCVAQGVPFAREYGGVLGNRSFGGVQVERTFYAQGQTGQQLLLGTYAAMNRQVARERVSIYDRHEMLDVVVVDGRARGIIARNLITGELERHAGHVVVLATGGYSKIYYLSTLAMGCNATAIWRAYRRGACFANPSMIQVHPTCLPPSGERQSKLTLMSESLRNDGRIWVPARAGDLRPPNQVPEQERDYYLERRYPAYGNLTPRDIASRAARERVEAGHGVGPLRNAVYLDFAEAVRRHGQAEIERRYGNLFAMYHKITGVSALDEPMLIAPAAHFSMGGLWVDYELMTTIEGLFALGECNFADHGANRLGANSLLQACVDGYFIAPATIGNYLAQQVGAAVPSVDSPEFLAAAGEAQGRIERLMSVQGSEPVDAFHRRLGTLLWNDCGIVRSARGLEAAIPAIRALSEEFWRSVRITGPTARPNSELEKALRMVDYLELGELMCRDALSRDESCGAHFRTEHQTPAGEALRNDADFAYVAAWQHAGDQEPILIREPLEFEAVTPVSRSYH